MTSPAKFWNQYVAKCGFKPNLSMAAGSAWHKALEHVFDPLTKLPVNPWKIASDSLLDAYNGILAETKDSAVDKFKKSFAKEMKDMERNLETYFQEKRGWDPGEHIERKVSMPSPVEGGLAISGVIDVVDVDGNPVDHKYVGQFSRDGAEKYYVQAWFYYYLVRQLTGKAPCHMIISEFKKTQNRDKGPQLREILIEYEARWMKKIDFWYEAVSQQILSQKTFMANPFQFFGGSDWDEYLRS